MKDTNNSENTYGYTAESKNSRPKLSTTLTVIMIVLVVFTAFFGGYFVSNVLVDEEMLLTKWLVETLNEHAYFVDYNLSPEFLLESGLDLATRYDPYVDLMTPEETADYQMRVAGSSKSFGFNVAALEDGGLIIYSVTKGSTADTAGVSEGMKIKEIDSLDVQDLSVNQLTTLLKTKEDNTDVVMKFYLPIYVDEQLTYSEDSVYETTIQRTEYTPMVVEYYDNETIDMLDENTAYIIISSFSGKTGEQFEVAMETFKEKGKTSLILDLRGNLGGSDINLMKVGSYLVKGEEGDKNPLIISEKFKDGSTRDIVAYNNYYEEMNFEDIIVLVDENSASASEALLTAMIDYKAVDLIIGETTYGKGTGLKTISMPVYNYAVTFTASYFFSPYGNSHENVGIEPTNGYSMINKNSTPYEYMFDEIFTRAVNSLK